MSTEKAKNVLSFHPRDTVRSIVKNLIANMDKFQDWENPMYYNIETLKILEKASDDRVMVEPLVSA